jgi:hypothetical protein
VTLAPREENDRRGWTRSCCDSAGTVIIGFLLSDACSCRSKGRRSLGAYQGGGLYCLLRRVARDRLFRQGVLSRSKRLNSRSGGVTGLPGMCGTGATILLVGDTGLG